MDPAWAYLTARAALDAIVAHYTTMDVPLPERRYVSGGAPAWDCEQVTVHVQRIFPHQGNVTGEAQTPLRAHPGFALRGLQLAVQLARCAPVGLTARAGGLTPPDVEDEETSAMVVLGDAVLVYDALVAAARARTLGGCNSVALVEWASIEASGGLVGGQVTVRVSV